MEVVILLLLCSFLTLHAYRPVGHLGCYRDWGNRILQGKTHHSNTNSGDECKHYCKSRGYRYAGTESTDQCYCGHVIRIQVRAHKCNHICPGNHNEKCGGHWKIDIYDTWHCATSPCINNAECKDNGADNYTCICSGEWTGRHCEEEKTTTTMRPTTTTTMRPTPTTTTTATLTPSPSTSTTATENVTELSTSTKRAINATDFPEVIKDDSAYPMIAVYVLLPLSAVVLLVATALFIKRRHRYKDEVPEVIYHGTGSIQNIYANSLAIPNNNQIEYEKHLTRNVSENSEVSAKDKDIVYRYAGLEDNEYNSINLRQNDTHGLGNATYDHVSNLKSVDETYSHLSTARHGRKPNAIMQDTYSQFEQCSGLYSVSEAIRNEDPTYNRFEMKGAPKTTAQTNTNNEESSDYDHTFVGLAPAQHSEADDYSRINDVAFDIQSVKNNNVCQLAVEKENGNEDEYAVVVKIPKPHQMP